MSSGEGRCGTIQYTVENHQFLYGITKSDTLHQCTIPCLKNCITCNHIKTNNYVTCTVTGQQLKFGNSGVENWNCSSENLVYLLTCKKCKIQYVGETERKLCRRFCEHRRNSSKQNMSHIPLYKHFSTNNHSPNDIMVEILQILPKSGDKDRDRKFRRDAELFWTKQLNTAYPYGLNTKIAGIGNLIEPLDVINKTSAKKNPYFVGLKIKRIRKINRLKKHKSYSKVKILDQVKIDKLKLEIDRSDMNATYNSMKQMNKKTVHWLLRECYENNVNNELCAILTAFIYSHQSDTKMKTDNDKPTSRIKISHVHQAVSRLQLGKMVRENYISKSLNRTIKLPWDVQICYTTETPAWVQICNYGAFLNKLDSQTLTYIMGTNCNCDPLYRNPTHNHVITGDLRIVKNEQLRIYMQQGTKFKENRDLTPEEMVKFIAEELDHFIIKLKTNKIIENKECEILKCAYFKTVQQNVNNYFQRNNTTNITLSNQQKSELRKLHKIILSLLQTKYQGITA